MAEIGLYTCQSGDKNTGWGNCPWEPGLIVLPIAIPKGSYFVNNDIADAAAFVKSMIFHDNPALRWYPLAPIVGLEDSTTEAGKETFGYGSSERAGVDFPVWTAKFRKGKMCAYKNARKFHGQAERFDWLFMDKNGKLIGWAEDVDGVTRTYGWDTDDVYVPMWKPGTNGTTVDYRIEWSFSEVEQLTDKLCAIETGLSPYNINGVVSLKLNKISEAADGVYNIKVEAACGRENIGKVYNGELDVTSAFLVTDPLGGAITYTITYNATAEYFTFNLDEADPQYPTVGDPIYITPAAVSVWEGLGVGDFTAGLAFEGLRLVVDAT